MRLQWTNDWIEYEPEELNEVVVGHGHYHLSRPFVLIYKNTAIKKLTALFEYLVNDAQPIYAEEGLSQNIHDIKISSHDNKQMTWGVNCD
jgi:hypothetical protein